MSADIYTKILERLLSKGLLQVEDLVEKGVLQETDIDRMMEEILQSEKDQIPEVVAFNSETPTDEFGRYKGLEFLAEGGMSKVFKAFDPELQRMVALKFLRTDDAGLKDRLLREARSQASIDHPNICKVYEVGELSGRPYIAMQHLAGVTLKDASHQLGLEQKVVLIKQIAESLQEAHRLGLIHRDIKPNNIIVEANENGQWVPYLVDFGLARQVAEPGMTQTDFLVGTPSYMSPEQASGKVHALDRRSDIYSLGVTFYELLCGQLPYKQSEAPMVQSVITEEAIPLRKRDSAIPSDLETIVMKCLEKEPNRRYESSKALADDLQRYLNGEPIHAKPAKFGYRILKKAKKNKIAAAIFSIAVLVTLVLTGMLVWVDWRSRHQTKHANEFNQEVRYIESMMRSVYMAPLHDIRPELNRARKRLQEMEKRVNQAGKYAFGPGHNALGQGYLVLRDYEKARHHLDTAWKSGYREGSTAYALGEVMGSLYQQRLSEVERIQNRESRDAARRELQKTYRNPALNFLKASVGSQRSTAFVEGLIAYFEQRYTEAEKKSSEAHKHSSWAYEAKKLEGDVYNALGRQAYEVGDHIGAIKAFDLAGKSYRFASDMGRSDQSIYIANCNSLLNVMLVEAEKGTLQSSHLNSALDACDNAVKINAEPSEAYRMKGFAYLTLGNFQFYNSNEDPRIALKKSMVLSKEAIKRNQKYAEAWKDLAAAVNRIGHYEITLGINPTKSMNEALLYIKTALKINPNYVEGHKVAGNIYAVLGEYLIEYEGDPTPPLKQSIFHFRKALQTHPSHSEILNNLGISFIDLGSIAINHGEDPRSSLQSAISEFKNALRFNPKQGFALNNLAFANFILGYWEIEQGRSPKEALQECIKYGEEGSRANPNNLSSYHVMLDCEALFMDYKIKNGENPDDSLDRSMEYAQRVLRIRPDSAMIFNNIAYCYQSKAFDQLYKGENPEASINSARDNIKKAVEIDKIAEIHRSYQATIELVAAKWALRNRRSPMIYINTADIALNYSIKLKPKNAYGYLNMSVRYLREAEWHHLKKKTAASTIRLGLEMIGRALSIRQWAEAQAVKGVLLLLQAQEEQVTSESIALLKNAQSILQQALNKNPLLKREYEPYLKKATELVSSASDNY